MQVPIPPFARLWSYRVFVRERVQQMTPQTLLQARARQASGNLDSEDLASMGIGKMPVTVTQASQIAQVCVCICVCVCWCGVC